MTAALAYSTPAVDFENVVARNRRRVLSTAYQITHDLDEAQDVAQYVFLQMYRRLPPLHDQRSIDRWLYVVTRNAALQATRRRSQEEALLQLGTEQQPERQLEETIVSNERAREVRALIARLPAADRDVLELRYLRALSTAEIAQHYGVSQARVKRDVERAKWRLRGEMIRYGMHLDL